MLANTKQSLGLEETSFCNNRIRKEGKESRGSGEVPKRESGGAPKQGLGGAPNWRAARRWIGKDGRRESSRDGEPPEMFVSYLDSEESAPTEEESASAKETAAATWRRAVYAPWRRAQGRSADCLIRIGRRGLRSCGLA